MTPRDSAASTPNGNAARPLRPRREPAARARTSSWTFPTSEGSEETPPAMQWLVTDTAGLREQGASVSELADRIRQDVIERAAGLAVVIKEGWRSGK